MSMSLSRDAIKEFLPAMRRIATSMEVDLLGEYGIDKKDIWDASFLQNQFTPSQLKYAMSIMGHWVKGSKFKVVAISFIKQKNMSWRDLVVLINTKMVEYANNVVIIEIGITKEGELSRSLLGTTFKHSLKEDSMKLKIIQKVLEGDGVYVPTSEIKKLVGAKTIESVHKQIGAFNRSIAVHLKLPQKFSLLEGKERSGYRINRIYNLVNI